MTTKEWKQLDELLEQAAKFSAGRQQEAFNALEQAESRKWILRRDHFKEAGSAARSAMSDAVGS